MPIEKIAEDNIGYTVDGIKFSDDFNTYFLNNNNKEFIQVWWKVFLKNPGAYMKAVSAANSGLLEYKML